MSETVSISTLGSDQRFDCYLARPAGKPRAAIVVIQEIFGVNAGIRRKCDRLAAEGYLALAPDLFCRLEPNVELDPDIGEELQKAFGLMGQFDQDEGVRDIEATIRYARNSEGCAKVGVVGYCLGGRLAFMAAARTDTDTSVGYYAVGIDNLLREKHAIANPLMLHIAGADHFVTPDVQRAMHEGLDDHPKVTLCDYPGLDHGFATEIGQRRNEAGATLADKRTAEFFAQHLG
uniref:dienelactone hydrolase family protein n=1 Tax=Altererythrobacter segetis TaxID=1104773 RepID=UPI00140AACF1|nr:dienelactone hydrolase family protein [Altererythrobacter segetis]